MKLVVVESPTKCRTLKKFLGKEYRLEATMGHIRDLPKKKLGVDIEKSFKPDWVVVPGKKKVVTNLKKATQKAEKIILATDLDREGEAIAWHVAALLRGDQRPKTKDQRPISRIVFHEITKSAIENALKNPREIDMDLVAAQKARRILDRLVGYKLSPLLWRKVRRGLSAGRVQSVAVRLIVEREREIEKFVSEEYWRIFAALSAEQAGSPFLAELVAKKGLPAGRQGVKYETRQAIDLFCGRHTVSKTSIANQKQAEQIIKELIASFIVKSVEKKEAFRYPPPAFTTSTLQQSCGRRFGWSGKMTMKLAQDLYERGLISYHRTDSTQLSQSAIRKIRQYIKENFCAKYLPGKPRIYKTKSKVAQEAHEAVRPTRVGMTNDQLPMTNEIGRNHQRLYDLVWRRTVACQMTPARLTRSNLVIGCGDYQFESRGQRLLFDGFLKVYPLKISENILPAIQKGDQLSLVSLGATKNSTTPPPRYTEAGLVKTLEKEGIGRPSTYAPIISLIQGRQYVEKLERKFQPTNLGEAVNDFLVKNFADIVDLPFTAQMEDGLDSIARGEAKWVAAIEAFYSPFEKKLSSVQEKAKRVKIETEKTGEKCPDCDGDLVIRIGKFGKFIACSNFPQCRFKKPYIEKLKAVSCPKCGAEVVIRKTKKGKRFYGCSNWPKCDWASWRRPK